MLFHSCDDSDNSPEAATYINVTLSVQPGDDPRRSLTLYLANATSKSPWDCIIDPAAKMALALPGSKARAVPNRSKACAWAPVCMYNRPSVRHRSVFSGEKLKKKRTFRLVLFSLSALIVKPAHAESCK